MSLVLFLFVYYQSLFSIRSLSSILSLSPMYFVLPQTQLEFFFFLHFTSQNSCILMSYIAKSSLNIVSSYFIWLLTVVMLFMCLEKSSSNVAK